MGSKAPDPPDPYKVAEAQTGTNINTAKAQQQIAMTGQVGPTGSVQYVLDPTSPSGYRQITADSPEVAALRGQSQDLQAQFNGTAGSQLGRVSDQLGTPFVMDAARGKVLSDIQQKMLDPMWDQRRSALETQLANEGIRQGSEAYATRLRQFEQQRADNYDKMFLDSYGQANNAALQEYSLPLQELSGLRSAAKGVNMPALPQFGATSSPGVAPTDLTGGVNSAYNAQATNARAAMGGLYGLGSAGLGGWAQAGFPSMWGASAAAPAGMDAAGALLML